MKWFGYGDPKIGEKEIFIAIPSMIISGGVLTMPNEVAKVTTGSDGWIAIVIGGIMTIFLAWLAARLAARFPGQTFLTYASAIISKPIAILITFIIAIVAMLTTAYVVRDIGNVAKEYMFNYTPIEVITLFFWLVVIYAVAGSRAGLFRLNMMFLPIVFVIGTSILLFNLKAFHLDNLLPVFKTDFSQYIKGINAGMPPYIGIGILLFYIAYVEKPKKAPKMAVLGMCVPIIFYVMVFITTIGVFGNEGTANLFTPTIELSKRAELPGEIFERLELIFFVIWIMTVFNTAAMIFDITVLAIHSIFKGMKKITIILIISPFVYLINMLPQDYEQLREFGSFITLSGMIVTILSIVVLLIIAKIRGVKASD